MDVDTERLRMDAYYYGFDPTGVREIDVVLSAVASAGKAFHHTEDWNDDLTGWSAPFAGSTPVEWIQNAAAQAATTITTQAARIKELEAGLEPFADRCTDQVRPNDDDESGLTVKVKHLRRARALIPGGAG